MVKIIFIEINLIKLVKIVKNKKCSEIFPESEKFNLDNFLNYHVGFILVLRINILGKY